MSTKNMTILGICRFSMLGRGDWKAYKNQPDDKLEEIYIQKALELFEATRIEGRLQTLKHLTLKSIAAQTDKDFKFLVVSSDRMPLIYQERLREICKGIEQVILKFVEPMNVSDIIRITLNELSWVHADTLQFRLDDDDCVSVDCIKRARKHASSLWDNQNFGLSFSQNYYCVTDGPTEGVYDWYSPFFSAAAMVRHRNRTVFQFGHYKIPSQLVSLTDPGFPNIITHRGDNDTPRFEAKILRKRGMYPAKPKDIEKMIQRHFNYLDVEGMALCTFDRVLRKR